MMPILKLYRGYANEQELVVAGHVFKPRKGEEYDFQKKSFRNARAVIQIFRSKTQGNADVYLEINNLKIHTKTLEDGYFKFCIPLNNEKKYGWIDYKVSTIFNNQNIEITGSYIRPLEGNVGVISDIDDTFLISHTRNPFRKLYIILFKNIYKRKLFDDVVAHYQALSSAGRLKNTLKNINNKNEQNAFFYVSSSEWNLYSYIVKFTEIHHLPRAVLLLKDIKTSLLDFFVTGRGDHNHKFEKIKHILEFYPNLQYVLLGDDSQNDPFLYENICKIFPVTVKAVYIRQNGNAKKEKVLTVLKNLETLNVAVCYFKNSSEAIAHSKKIGII